MSLAMNAVEEDLPMSALDPIQTDPDKYRVLFENDRVRVLEYRDTPGAKTKPHQHPNSVLLMLSDFHRRLTVGDVAREVTVTAGQAAWSPAQVHIGENIGTTDSYVIFVELKD
jgi:beta-alanine degradation protein BauB